MRKSFGYIALLLLFITCTVVYSQTPAKLSSEHSGTGAKAANSVSVPIPTPLLNGKKVFISLDADGVRAGQEYDFLKSANNELYADLKKWGHYELVSDPQQADLIFSLRIAVYTRNDISSVQIVLEVSDVKTHVVLWGFVEGVSPAFRVASFEKNSSIAVKKVVNDIQNLLDSAVPVPFAEVNPATASKSK